MKIARIFVAAILSLGAAVLSPSAAFAHDQVLKTTPSDGSTVSAGIVNLSVTFNENILNLNNGKGEVFQLMAPGGNNASTNCVSIKGPTMSEAVDLDKPGKYTVVWQSVSQDGHLNTGFYRFTLENKNGYKAAPAHNCQSANPGPSTTQAPVSGAKVEWKLQNTIQVILFIMVVIGGAGLLVRRYLRGRNQKGSK